MERQKKYGVCCSFLLLLFLYGICFVSSAQARVQLQPRVNAQGEILKNDAGAAIANEDYVFLGKFDHRLMEYSGVKEVQATPILWRVMSADSALGNQRKVTMLTHHLLESMAYQNQYDDRGWGEAPQYVRPGTMIPMNTWLGSEVQKWLSSSGMVTVYQWDGSGVAPNSVRGFLHSDYFNAAEIGALLPYPDGTGALMTLPSFWTTADMQIGYDWYEWPYFGEMYLWFGDNDADSSFNYGPNNLARRASFKGSSFIYGGDNQGWFYWSRSPVADVSDTSGSIIDDGTLFNEGVIGSVISVRPACLLNIESLIFKSASDDFTPASSSSAIAGSPKNPYVLVFQNLLPTGVPTGWIMKFTTADEAPLSAQIDGKILTMEWNTPLSPGVKRWPAPGDFKLSTGETAISITSDDTSPKLLKLTFATGVTAGTAVTLSYNLNTDAISFDSAGGTAKVADSFANRPVKNVTSSGGGGTMDTVVRPVATPPGGIFIAPQVVELTSATPGAAIYYTLDCSDPVTSPTRQKYTVPIIVPMNTMLKAYAVKSGMYDSALLIQCYIQKDTVFMPIASPPGGIFRSEQTVYLSSETIGANIYYTLDGSDPVTNPKGTRQTYTKALRIPLGTTLKAYAAKEGLLPSAVLTETYAPDNETCGGGCDAGVSLYALFLLLGIITVKKIM